MSGLPSVYEGYYDLKYLSNSLLIFFLFTYLRLIGPVFQKLFRKIWHTHPPPFKAEFTETLHQKVIPDNILKYSCKKRLIK